MIVPVILGRSVVFSEANNHLEALKSEASRLRVGKLFDMESPYFDIHNGPLTIPSECRLTTAIEWNLHFTFGRRLTWEDINEGRLLIPTLIYDFKRDRALISFWFGQYWTTTWVCRTCQHDRVEQLYGGWFAILQNSKLLFVIRSLIQRDLSMDEL